jgi:DNA-binding transcriptional regulator YiaG
MRQKTVVKRRTTKSQATSRRLQAPKNAEGLTIVQDDRGRSVLQLRSRLGLTRDQFARLVPVSVRHLATIESNQKPTEPVRRRFIELGRMIDALEQVIQAKAIGPWLTRPNEALGGLKPIEVIERGEVDRIWEMIFFLRSGEPF